jgi:hypothetical protein
MPGQSTITMGEVEDLRRQLQATQAIVLDLQRELAQVKDIQAVQWLLNRYTALHDEAMYDMKKRKEWENLFAEDGMASYPYGQHVGREGKGDWAFGGVKYFEVCTLLSSNFDITFSDDRQTAFVRTNCIAQWLKNKNKLDDLFDEGGFYHWTLVRDKAAWKIGKVHLTITWTRGDDPTGIGSKKDGAINGQ